MKKVHAIQKKEEQTTPTPYTHPNYNRHFDQRQGQNEFFTEDLCGHAKISTY